MNRSIEDRVVAALEARAEQVRPEDLGPLEIPERSRRLRPGVVVLLVAAASAAVVAVPFFVAGGGNGSDPVDKPSASPSVTAPASPTPTEPTSPSEPPSGPSVVVDRQRADVDGDGRPDEVEVLVAGPDKDEPGDGSVEVTLAGGSAGGGASLPFGYPGPLEPALDLNGDGREQVLLRFTAGGDSGSLLVFTWHEGGFVEARYDGDAPLGIEQAGDGLVLYYYVDEGVLYSWQRTEPVAGGPVWNVAQWSWSVDGDRLVATRAADACVDVTSQDQPQPC